MSMNMPDQRPNVQLPIDSDEADMIKRALRGYAKNRTMREPSEQKTIARLVRRVDAAARKLAIKRYL